MTAGVSVDGSVDERPTDLYAGARQPPLDEARHRVPDRAPVEPNVRGLLADGQALDGRRARRDRNMAAVIDALLGLFAEGQLHPTAQQLADRSEVSLRSVFRYFDDMADLTLRAVEYHLERIDHLYELAPRPAGAPLAERIATIADHRAGIYFAVAPVARAVAIRYHRSPALLAIASARRQTVRRQTAEYFAPELDQLVDPERAALFGCIDAAMLFETAENLLRYGDVEPHRLAAAFRLSVGRLLAPLA